MFTASFLTQSSRVATVSATSRMFRLRATLRNKHTHNVATLHQDAVPGAILRAESPDDQAQPTPIVQPVYSDRDTGISIPTKSINRGGEPQKEVPSRHGELASEIMSAPKASVTISPSGTARVSSVTHADESAAMPLTVTSVCPVETGLGDVAPAPAEVEKRGRKRQKLDSASTERRRSSRKAGGKLKDGAGATPQTVESENTG